MRGFGAGRGKRQAVCGIGEGLPGGKSVRLLLTGAAAVIVLTWVAAWLLYACSAAPQRAKLPSSAVVETHYYVDEGGWFSDGVEVERGMKAFYRSTGVQPFLYVLPNGHSASAAELTEMAEELYAQLFLDEGHFLLVFCDDGKGSYTCGYTVGAKAKTVMDDAAVAVLAEQLNRNYNDFSIGEEEIFSRTFSHTARRIMKRSGPPVWAVAACDVLIAAAAVICLYRQGRSPGKRLLSPRDLRCACEEASGEERLAEKEES